MLTQARFTLGLFLLLFVSTICADIAVPALTQRVTDLTATLTAAQVSTLENKIAAFEAKKGSQIAVLMLPSTQPEDIAAFGIRVAEAWKIGRKNIDDGVILIVAKDDRKLRLEVGYGLEGAIPDAIAKRILAETIKPYFKNNDYAGGIDAGVEQLIKLIEGETLPAVVNANSERQDYLALLFPLLIGIVLIQAFRLRDRSGSWGSTSSSWSSGDSDSSSSSSSSDDWGGGGGGSFGGGGASDSW